MTERRGISTTILTIGRDKFNGLLQLETAAVILGTHRRTPREQTIPRPTQPKCNPEVRIQTPNRREEQIVSHVPRS